jgi:hypothetical protein
LIKRFGKLKGYGFVHLKGDVDQICKEFNGKTVEGKELKVEVAEPKKPHVAPAADFRAPKAPKVRKICICIILMPCEICI